VHIFGGHQGAAEESEENDHDRDPLEDSTLLPNNLITAVTHEEGKGGRRRRTAAETLASALRPAIG
jgi:hypothetical protein